MFLKGFHDKFSKGLILCLPRRDDKIRPLILVWFGDRHPPTHFGVRTALRQVMLLAKGSATLIDIGRRGLLIQSGPLDMQYNNCMSALGRGTNQSPRSSEHTHPLACHHNGMVYSAGDTDLPSYPLTHPCLCSRQRNGAAGWWRSCQVSAPEEASRDNQVAEATMPQREVDISSLCRDGTLGTEPLSLELLSASVLDDEAAEELIQKGMLSFEPEEVCLLDYVDMLEVYQQMYTGKGFMLDSVDKHKTNNRGSIMSRTRTPFKI